MKLRKEVKEDIERQFRKIRENNLIIVGISTGVVGSLIAGVINDLIKNSPFYPWKYLYFLISILLILVSILLVNYFKWKIFQHKLNKRLRYTKQILDKVKEFRIKNGN